MASLLKNGGFQGASQAAPRRVAAPSSARLPWLVPVVLLMVALISHPGRVAAKTLAILPEVFPNAPIRPLLLVTSPPRHRELTWDSPAGRVDADLYTPADSGTHGGIVLYTGAFGLRRAENLVRFAEALARSGAIVLVPESESLQRGDIRREEITALVQAVEVLHAEPTADRARIGLSGFSVGATFALLAAEDPRGGELASFVNVLGGYFDARSTLIPVASGQIEADGALVPWKPDHVTRFTFAKHLIEALPDDGDRALLWDAFPNGETSSAPLSRESLSDHGAVVLELLSGTSRARAEQLVTDLSPSAQAWLNSVSPSGSVASLRPALYVMHDRSDVFIPFTESRTLVAAAPPQALRLYTESELFAHVTPDRDLPLHLFAYELWKLFRHLCMVGGEFL
jgi:acetyl esterase/lipase